ncbi:cupredoxin family protein [Methylocaldum sp.]|uniref:cupredoxin domain-containing protein n=1 Tax=Methylocaldum sp. TaxID=1969727 RepID=UPI002D350BDB|nr:cupredoxin family protein [Methylocaldum sp.]HYE34566.1 cupredoxin family protein [Methylocaldum sp.]
MNSFDKEDTVKSGSIYPVAALALVMSAVTVQAQNPESPTSSGSRNQAHPEAHFGHGTSAAGQTGKPDEVTRTVEIKTLDSMKYEPSSFTVNRGETVRLVVFNPGRLTHEAVIGTAAEQQTHAAEMITNPGMAHDGPSYVTVEPGETKELVWRFDQSGQFEIGCHIPGHYPTGMVAEITVR